MGWILIIETDEQPPWTSSVIALTGANHLALRRTFPKLLERLNDDNPPIEPQEEVFRDV